MSRPPTDLLPFNSKLSWMRALALPDEKGMRHLPFLYQWERSQSANPEAFRQQMFGQLGLLTRAAFEYTAHYEKTFAEANFDPSQPLDEETWASLPILSRKEIQTQAEALTPRVIPKSQRQVKRVSSSGSTGTPIQVNIPPIRGYLWAAATLHEHILHDRDFAKKAAAIRVVKDGGIGPQGRHGTDWGKPFTDLFHTGPATMFDIHQDPELQADWLIREDPGYLLAFPSSLEALLPILKDKKAELPGLDHFRTMSEQLPSTLREDVYRQFGRKIVDMYSAQEVGYIALQCPAHDHYHLFQDICFTEILREDGTPCAPGEIGRVVVTDPYNFVFPIIRYDTGDFAEMGEPCDCGRSHPVIKRVMGRVRNLITLPDGSRHWPMTASRRLHEIGAVVQFQLIQSSLKTVEANLVCEKPLDAEQKAKMVETIQNRLGYPFDVAINEVNSIPRGANGKFEEFRSEVTPETAALARANHQPA